MSECESDLRVLDDKSQHIEHNQQITANCQTFPSNPFYSSFIAISSFPFPSLHFPLETRILIY